MLVNQSMVNLNEECPRVASLVAMQSSLSYLFDRHMMCAKAVVPLAQLGCPECAILNSNGLRVNVNLKRKNNPLATLKSQSCWKKERIHMGICRNSHGYM
jgi:hypothetical protein